MSNKATKCPMCMTKMNQTGHDLVCPVCGYKYCGGHQPYTYDDHNHSEYQSYSRKTSYTGPKTTSQAGGTQQYSSSGSSRNHPSAGRTTPPRQNSSSTRQTKKPTKANRFPKIIKIIMTIYIISLLVSSLESCISEDTFRAWMNDMSLVLQSVSDMSMNDNSPVMLETNVITAPAYDLSTWSDGKSSLVRDMMCAIYNKGISEITAEDCAAVEYLMIYPEESDGTLTVYYGLLSNESGSFDSDYTEFDSSEFQAFPNLEYLECSQVLSSPFQPGDLKGLHHLTTLGCTNSPEELKDIVPTDTLTSLTIYSPLRPISLDGIEAFSRLDYLEVTAAEITDASAVGQLSRLSTLLLMDNGTLSDLSFVENLKGLISLHLYTPGIQNADFLWQMEHLGELTISGCNVPLDLSGISACRELSWLYLDENSALLNCDSIAQCTELMMVHMDSSNLSDLSWASSLENLQYLIVPNNSIASLAPLENLEKLSYVICEGNPITDLGSLDPAKCIDYYNE